MRRSARSERLEVPGPAGPLETLVETPPGAGQAVAVVCHPHPLHGGTLENKVVYTLARSFRNLGAVSVRFNFRGVGASVGEYADGVGELADALAVVEWVRRERPEAGLYLGGFSFGAAVALQAAAAARVRGLVTVALPVARVPADFLPPACPWLAVLAAEDELVGLAEAERWLAARGPAAEVAVVAGASHFFHGKLNELGRRVESFFAADFETRGAAGAANGRGGGRAC